MLLAGCELPWCKPEARVEVQRGMSEEVVFERKEVTWFMEINMSPFLVIFIDCGRGDSDRGVRFFADSCFMSI